MIRKFVDALAFAALVAAGCAWSATAFGQSPIINNPGLATGTGYPQGAQPIQAQAAGTTAGATATLTGATGRLTFVCGFSVSPGSATAAITISVTTSGFAVGQTYFVGAPVTAAGTTGATLTQTFSPCIPASAVNSQMSVIAGALGTGGVNQNVNVWGYQAVVP